VNNPSNRVALYLQDTHDLRQCIDLVQYAESRGFEAVWQADSRFARDAFIPLAAFAAVTKRVKLGAGVVNPWTRHPAQIAAALLTLDDLAPGRVMVGFGIWDESLAHNSGVGRVHPLLALRETVNVVRDLLAMQHVNFHGSVVNVTDLALEPRRRSEARAVPLYIGASGLKTLALAGEIADGILLNHLTAVSYNGQALEALDRGARTAGRQMSTIDCAQVIVVSVDKDRDKALKPARRLVAQYIGQQPALMRASGVPEDVINEISHIMGGAAMPTEAQIDQAMVAVPDEVVQLLTAAGTPEEVRAKVSEYRAAGCQCPVLFPLNTDVRLVIDTFAVL
jgi:5,10-methylenetetrahydromethanopterin reductase